MRILFFLCGLISIISLQAMQNNEAVPRELPHFPGNQAVGRLQGHSYLFTFPRRDGEKNDLESEIHIDPLDHRFATDTHQLLDPFGTDYRGTISPVYSDNRIWCVVVVKRNASATVSVAMTRMVLRAACELMGQEFVICSVDEEELKEMSVEEMEHEFEKTGLW